MLIPNFIVKPLGNLLVGFEDASQGTGLSYAWDFGFLENGNPKVSSLVNNIIQFPNPGSFTVTLSVTDSTETKSISQIIIVKSNPTIGVSILELIRMEVPSIVTSAPNYIITLIRKWQLVLQGALSIDDSQVFNELAWPELANVLISKLVLFDIISYAQTGSLMSQISMSSTSVILYDYHLEAVPNYPINLRAIVMANGTFNISSSNLSTLQDLLDSLNNLSLGTFFIDSGEIKTNNNLNTLISLKYNIIGDTQELQVSFIKDNQITTTQSGVNATSGMARGPVKKIETGPSNAEWYDPTPTLKAMATMGVMDNLKYEVCSLARVLGIKLGMCRALKKTHLFEVFHTCKDLF